MINRVQASRVRIGPRRAPPRRRSRRSGPRAAGQFSERFGRVGGGLRVAAALGHVAAPLLGPLMVAVAIGPTIGALLVSCAYAARCIHNASVAEATKGHRRPDFLREHVTRALTDVGMVIAAFVLSIGALLLTRSLEPALLILLPGLLLYAFRVCSAVVRACHGRRPCGRRVRPSRPGRTAPGRGVRAVVYRARPHRS